MNKGKKKFFTSDPPHLIKTLGNNPGNSHGHLNTRHLIVRVFLLIVLSFFLLYCKCVFPRNVEGYYSLIRVRFLVAKVKKYLT